jgi:site-specific recombinase XerD
MDSLPFDAVTTRYLQARANTHRPGTVEGYKYSIRSLQTFLQAHDPQIRQLRQLKRRPHVEAWLRAMATRRPAYANATRARVILQVRRFLKDIVEWGWTRAPVADLLTTRDLPPLAQYLPKPLAPEVDVRIQQALRDLPDLCAKGLLLARRTGLRIGELSNLEHNCLIGEPRGPWSLRVPPGKLRKERAVPVDEETRKIVVAIRDECARRPAFTDPQTGHPVKLLLCHPDGRRVSTQRFRLRLKEIAQSLAIEERVHPHRLRHTYATEMLRYGVNLLGVMRLLGHRNPRMTLRYLEINQEDLTKAYLKANQQARQRYSQLAERIHSTTANTLDPAEVSLLATVDDLIKRLQHIRFDQPQSPAKKKIQRVVETLRRVQTKLPELLP